MMSGKQIKGFVQPEVSSPSKLFVNLLLFLTAERLGESAASLTPQVAQI